MAGRERNPEMTLSRRTVLATAARLGSGAVALALILLPLLVQATFARVAADPFADLQLIRPRRATPAQDFTVPALAGRSLRLRDFRGRVVLLNFWATWCPPCKEEMPSMERLYQRYRGRGFAIVAISIDADSSAVDPFVRKLGLTFPIGLDPRMVVANQYAVRALPSTVLIDRGQNTVAVAVGPRDWDGTPARTVVESLVK
jgi:peroxiredoxin